MSKAKEQHTIDFERIFSHIDAQSKLLNKSTDSLRFQIKSMCDVLGRTFDKRDDAKFFFENLPGSYWANKRLAKYGTRWTVEAEGKLVARLKRVGLMFQSTYSFNTEVDPEGGVLETWHVSFLKIHNAWGFYAEKCIPGAESSELITLDNLPRELLSDFAAAIPIFLEEYSCYIEKKNAELIGKLENTEQLLSSIK